MGSVPDNYKKPFSKPLCFGMKGAEIERLQDWLNELNIYYSFCQSPKALKLNGIFDDSMLRMVMAFQGFWDYRQTGIYDIQTHDLLEWKFWNYLWSEMNLAAWWDREKENKERIHKESMKKINKLFKDGKFGK